MAITGRKAIQVEIKSDGDVFHELYMNKPHHVSNLSPDLVQGCNLHEGGWGTVGSVISWNYFHDGEYKVAKEIITDVNEAKKSITFKVIEADLLEVYKTFLITIHVDKMASGNSLVTWTVEYEKLNEDVPDPDTVLELFRNITKDIETQHIKQ